MALALSTCISNVLPRDGSLGPTLLDSGPSEDRMRAGMTRAVTYRSRTLNFPSFTTRVLGITGGSVTPMKNAQRGLRSAVGAYHPPPRSRDEPSHKNDFRAGDLTLKLGSLAHNGRHRSAMVNDVASGRRLTLRHK